MCCCLFVVVWCLFVCLVVFAVVFVVVVWIKDFYQPQGVFLEFVCFVDCVLVVSCSVDFNTGFRLIGILHPPIPSANVLCAVVVVVVVVHLLCGGCC